MFRIGYHSVQKPTLPNCGNAANGVAANLQPITRLLMRTTLLLDYKKFSLA
jgi:hypothetical protein